MSMFTGHPKGLFVAFFTNMGERFGFYTMMAILVLFLQTKYGLDEGTAGSIYSIFYFSIYILALVGGFIADSIQKYSKVILAGVITMTVGYALMALPGMSLPFVIGGLFVIAFGNGLFKGNLQAMVGKLYDDPKYEKLRDPAFNIFYMGINVGAFFAPSAATAIRNWYLSTQGFLYDKALPSTCHAFLDGKTVDTALFQELANKVSGTNVADLSAFANNYINAFSTGYNYAFGIAACAMIVSLVIYLLFKKHMAYADTFEKKEKGMVSFKEFTSEEKDRLKSLGLVFLVVIFFWMSFHQNGLTLTLFARDYIAKEVGPMTNLIFDLRSLLSIVAAIFGLTMLLKKGGTGKTRGIGLLLLAAGGAFAYYIYGTFSPTMPIGPEIFQQFNPLYIVFVTPLVVGFFTFLRNKNMEPSTPRKIGIGMIITTVAFGILAIGSFGLVAPSQLATAPEQDVSPYLLVGTYFTLTIAELFLSPMGLSFVSKVAPNRIKGLMQGCWLGATALGNLLLGIGTFLWARVEVWQLWIFFAICCIISAVIIFSKMKFLERVTKG